MPELPKPALCPTVGHHCGPSEEFRLRKAAFHLNNRGIKPSPETQGISSSSNTDASGSTLGSRYSDGTSAFPGTPREIDFPLHRTGIEPSPPVIPLPGDSQSGGVFSDLFLGTRGRKTRLILCRAAEVGSYRNTNAQNHFRG